MRHRSYDSVDYCSALPPFASAAKAFLDFDNFAPATHDRKALKALRSLREPRRGGLAAHWVGPATIRKLGQE
jgi:hypothetical protein